MYILIHTYMATKKSSSSPVSSPVPPSLPAAPAPLAPLVLSTGLSLRQLLQRFRALFPRKALALWLADRVFYDRGFTPLIILWYLVFEHLSGKRTLEDVLENARDGEADRLSTPGKPPLSQTLRSDSTASWSNARGRLPVAVVHQALRFSGEAIRATISNRPWHGLEPALLDGTTYRLRPWGDISEQFPPHGGGNNRAPYWCLARSVVAFCLATGVVRDCATGPTQRSEQALTQEIWKAQLWENTIFVADRNFGVYSVVRGVRSVQAHLVVRLTEARAKKLAREAGVNLEAGCDQVLEWKPTRHDQCPEGLSREPVVGRLIALQVHRPGARSFMLYLFTTLVDPQITAQEWVQLYGERWQVELNLRYVKTQMGLEAPNCKSADMARKLWLSGLMAYNLVRASMCLAAARSHQPVLRLSFHRSRKALLQWLPKIGKPTELASWEHLLDRIAKFRLPHRCKRRPSEPRAIRYFKNEFPKLTGDRAKAREKLSLVNPKS
jgi:hypothetical protein